MVLSMTRPTKRPGSSLQQYRKRVPSDLLVVAAGRQISLALPSERPGGEEAIVSVKIGREAVSLSLRTRSGAREEAKCSGDRAA